MWTVKKGNKLWFTFKIFEIQKLRSEITRKQKEFCKKRPEEVGYKNLLLRDVVIEPVSLTKVFINHVDGSRIASATWES